MFQYHCLNPIAEKGLGLFDEDYKKTEELEGTDAILVRSAKILHNNKAAPLFCFSLLVS